MHAKGFRLCGSLADGQELRGSHRDGREREQILTFHRAPRECGDSNVSKMTDKPSLRVFRTSSELAAAAALDAASVIREAVAARGQARLIAATGASQLAFLDRLVREPDIDWPRVELFHLDEYVGLSADHPASFRRYLMERLIRPSGMQTYHFLDGEGDPEEVCRTVGAALASAPIDVAFAGIGENGHLAFNDPPADFETDAPYIVVELDEPCRRQQVGEGWFASVDDVPDDRDLDDGPADPAVARDHLRGPRSP